MCRLRALLIRMLVANLGNLRVQTRETSVHFEGGARDASWFLDIINHSSSYIHIYPPLVGGLEHVFPDIGKNNPN